jgi:hypothetical protein
MQTNLLLEFADKEYRFFLTVDGLLELQEKSGVGIGALLARVLAGRYTDEQGKSFGFPLDAQWHVQDLLETIRLALIGGGLGPVEAKHLMSRYCYPAQPLSEAWKLAAAIIGAAVEGIPDNTESATVKKKSAPRTRKGGSSATKSMPT